MAPGSWLQQCLNPDDSILGLPMSIQDEMWATGEGSLYFHIYLSIYHFFFHPGSLVVFI